MGNKSQKHRISSFLLVQQKFVYKQKYGGKLDETVLWHCNFTFDYLNILLSFGENSQIKLIFSSVDNPLVPLTPSISFQVSQLNLKPQVSNIWGSQPHQFLKNFLNFSEFEPSFL